jgi:hypothetical protein
MKIIIAPHADDEIIGCFSILKRGVPWILFGTPLGVKEAKVSANYFGFQPLQISDLPQFMKKESTFFFPDPYFELHPLHRQLGALGEKLFREGEDVIFYTTNMNTPYIRETEKRDEKLEAMNYCYPEKSDLWKYEHKFYLFEGHCKWINYE